MQHVVLKSGGWVDLREPSEVPERLRRPARRLQVLLAQQPAFAAVVAQAAKSNPTSVHDFAEAEAADLVTKMGVDAFDLMDQLNDHAVLQRVMGWSFGPAVTLEALQDLPGAVYDELRELCADGALQDGPEFGPSTDEASPTVPSTA